MSAQNTGYPAPRVALVVVSAAVGIWLLTLERRPSDRSLHLLLAFATLLITAVVAVATDPLATVLLATLSVFVSVSAFFFAWPQILAHLTLTTVCTVTVLGVHPGTPWWTGVAVSGFVVALTVIGKSFLDLAVAAEFDAVTGLPDRRGFDRHLALWICGAPTVHDVALVLVGIDARARPGPDAIVLAVLDAWGPVLEAGVKLGRRDDDQIAILHPHATAADALALVERLRAVAPAACHAGVTMWRIGDSAAQLINRAEAALLRSKSTADGRTVMDVAVDVDARRLKLALERGELEIGYQPIVGLAPGYPLVGVEALLRWPGAVPTAPSPWELVRIAERSGFAAELDDHVLRTACRGAAELRRTRGDGELMLSVNVSPMSLLDPDLVGRVDAVLAETAWPAERLTFEVTEEMLDLRGGAAMRTLRELRERGIGIAVDDFGTGYSSLSRLQALSVDRLKLDKSITAAITPECDEPPALLRAVAAMAEALEFPVTVEGVETPHQLEILTGIGFDQAQGYLFGTAVAIETLVASLEQDELRKGSDGSSSAAWQGGASAGS